ncbi:MAG TPA: imidazole glycerol phosphate synthase subunit HisF [Clostridia bacterium]|nr:imidazole glycerol phosphate synthase subunit HisF [Clostridia bacterium]
MLTRIIPCLDIRDGRVVKGVKFADLKDAGDPIEIAKAYAGAGADELFLLNVAATAENRAITLNIIREITRKTDIPLTVGGGISKLENFHDFFSAGAHKVSISSAALKTPELITEVADHFGSKHIVVAIDVIKGPQGNWSVCVDGGKVNTGMDAVKWAMRAEELGAGEILLTSMDRDGTKEGYDIELLRTVSGSIDIPVIASGGAGRMAHFLDAIIKGGACAVLAASLFHYKELEIGTLKEYLWQNGVKTSGKEG